MSTLDNPNDRLIDPASVPARPIGVRYGLIAALLLVVVGLVFQALDLVDYSGKSTAMSWVANFINWGILAAAMVMAVRKHRDEELGGYITFGRGFSVGFWIALVVAVVMVAWTYLYFTVIAPDTIDSILEMTKERMAEQQGMSDSDIDQALGMVSWMFSPLWMSVVGGGGMLVMGIIISLIVAAVMKKNPPEMV